MLGLVAGYQALRPDAASPPVSVPASTSSGVHEGLLYARVTTVQRSTYEGRIRWGGDQEALWGDHFNGAKEENPWAGHVPPGQLPKERFTIGVLGFQIAGWERDADLSRPFVARMGDIERIELGAREIRVMLKSGSEFMLDRFGSDDVADGVRVWDAGRVIDLDEWQVRSIEFRSAAGSGDAPFPLRGTVRTAQREFTGLIQWNRQAGLDSDELHGLSAEGERRLRFDTIGSIARVARDTSLVTLLDGSELVLSGTREVGAGNRGVYVDDERYGRVLISWGAFERVDFSPGGTGPSYDDFAPGSPLSGSVATRSGRRLIGRLVYDLDESETTETLDAPWQGVDYNLAFGLIASISPSVEGAGDQARVTLHSGEELLLERSGDLGPGNAGVLVFSEEDQSPQYVPWGDVALITLDRPASTAPPPSPG